MSSQLLKAFGIGTYLVGSLLPAPLLTSEMRERVAKDGLWGNCGFGRELICSTLKKQQLPGSDSLSATHVSRYVLLMSRKVSKAFKLNSDTLSKRLSLNEVRTIPR